MDDDLDLDAAGGLASSDKGKPRASRKAVVPKPKKVLTPEQRAKESVKRKDRSHAMGARDEAIAAAAAQQQVTNARIVTTTREALCTLGLNPSQHGLVNAVVAAAVSTGSSAFPRKLLPDSPDTSACNPVPGLHVYPQASRLSGECSPEPEARGNTRGRRQPTSCWARNLFDGMPATGDDDYMQNMIFEGGAQAAVFDPDETQSQDGRGYNEDQAAFMRDQVGLDLDDFLLDHEFPEDYGLEKEDECDIEAEPLFDEE
ncbi:Eyes absent-like protein 4 [Hordeum vulgare]|nr:Eyes absent-like protein 4 [Hordeum vulgare]